MERRLELLAEMTPAIWVHLIAILLAAFIGAFVLWRRKGDARHKRAGRVWVGLMFVAAISSFFIQDINEGGYSPIHGLSVLTLLLLAVGLLAIRLRARLPNALRWHRGALQSLYASGIMIAGGFTFLPHRLLGRLTFGETYPWINIAFIVCVVSGGIWLLFITFKNGRAATERL